MCSMQSKWKWGGMDGRRKAKHRTNASTSAISSQMQAETERVVCNRFSSHLFHRFVFFLPRSYWYAPSWNSLMSLRMTAFLLYRSYIFAFSICVSLVMLQPFPHCFGTPIAKISFLANDMLWLGSPNMQHSSNTATDEPKWKQNLQVSDHCNFLHNAYLLFLPFLFRHVIKLEWNTFHTPERKMKERNGLRRIKNYAKKNKGINEINRTMDGWQSFVTRAWITLTLITRTLGTTKQIKIQLIYIFA